MMAAVTDHPVRLCALGLWHEANTFVATTVGSEALRAVTRRHEQLTSDGDTTMAGFLRLPHQQDLPRAVSVTPLIAARLTPGGPLDGEAFTAYLGEALDLLRQHGPWDGVLLELHGACATTDRLDPDGDFLEAVRSVVGEHVPIGAALDLHANVSPRMAAAADVLNGYRTNPHVDAAARALDVATLVAEAATGHIRPRVLLRQIPAVINILRQNTSEQPMRDLIAASILDEEEPGVLSASIFEGFPYADVPEMGMSVVVVADEQLADGLKHAQTMADSLAAQVFSAREGFTAHAPGAAEAVEAVASLPQPVLLLDVGDNIGGGTSGTSTELLSALVAGHVPRTFAILQDPEGAAMAYAAGPGSEVTVSLGGTDDTLPLSIAGTVSAVHDGAYRSATAGHAGQVDYDTGVTVALTHGAGCVLVLTSRLEIPSSLQQLTDMGLNLRDRVAIVAKGVHSPLVAYEPIAGSVVRVDTTGPTRADITALHHVHRRRPLFPFEPATTFDPSPNLDTGSSHP